MRREVPAEPKTLGAGGCGQALDDLGDTFDVSREDLALLFGRAEAHALARQKAS